MPRSTYPASSSIEETIMGNLERRSGGLVQADAGRVIGYAAVFGPLSEDLGGFRERVDRQAFNRSLQSGKDIRALVDHDSAKVLGRSSNQTLRLAADDHGLRVEIDLPNTTYAADIRALLERGDVSQMSFGFLLSAGGDKWERSADGSRLRTLLDVDLIEVSLVSIPAYPDTSAAVRSMRGVEAKARAQDLWLVRNRLSQWLGKR